MDDVCDYIEYELLISAPFSPHSLTASLAAVSVTPPKDYEIADTGHFRGASVSLCPCTQPIFLTSALAKWATGYYPRGSFNLLNKPSQAATPARLLFGWGDGFGVSPRMAPRLPGEGCSRSLISLTAILLGSLVSQQPLTRSSAAALTWSVAKRQ